MMTDRRQALVLPRVRKALRSTALLPLTALIAALSACDGGAATPREDDAGRVWVGVEPDASQPDASLPALDGGPDLPDPPEDPPPPPPGGALVSADLIAEVSLEELRAAVEPEVRPFLQHALAVYRMVYLMEDRGEMVRASAALVLPVTAVAKSIVAFNHYTIFLETRIPSNATRDNPDNFLGRGALLAASAGYAVVAPDYLGYGEDRARRHPYEISDALADAVIGAVLATQEHMAAASLGYDGRVFMVGFSEGASASVAAHRAIEAGGYPSIRLGGTVACGGCYQLGVLAEQALATDEHELAAPGAAVNLMVAYDDYYSDLRRGPAYYLDDSTADLVEGGLLDGERTWSAVNVSFRDEVGRLFTPEFLSEVRAGTSPLIARLHDNDLVDWAPRAPIRLVAGTRDLVCPAFQTEALHAHDQTEGEGVTTLSLVDEDHNGVESSCGDEAVLAIEAWRR